MIAAPGSVAATEDGLDRIAVYPAESFPTRTRKEER
jgi:hypothetical protein